MVKSITANYIIAYIIHLPLIISIFFDIKIIGRWNAISLHINKIIMLLQRI